MTDLVSCREFPRAACALIVREDMRFLCVTRAKSERPFTPRPFTGYGFPGGKYEPEDLHLVRTVVREVGEETGLLVRPVMPIFVALSGVVSGNHAVTTFLCQVIGETIKRDLDTQTVWFDQDDCIARSEFPLYNQYVIEAFRRRTVLPQHGYTLEKIS
jgi:8-oxo-dGTP pyrophosphatase MutT (NUDIX family)